MGLYDTTVTKCVERPVEIEFSDKVLSELVNNYDVVQQQNFFFHLKAQLKEFRANRIKTLKEDREKLTAIISSEDEMLSNIS